MLRWTNPPNESEYQQAEDDLAEAEMPVISPVQAEEPQPAIEPGAASTETPAVTPKRAIGTFGEAIEAVRQGDFDAAIPFLQLLVRQHPNYHVGWLRLGYAQREQAARLTPDQREIALAQLVAAVESFTHALGHVDSEYRASSYYERSKTFYRKYVIGGDRKDAESAMDDAQEACVLSSDVQFKRGLLPSAIDFTEHYGTR